MKDRNLESAADQIPDHLGEEWDFWWPTDKKPPKEKKPATKPSMSYTEFIMHRFTRVL